MSKQWPTLYVKTASGSTNFWVIRTDGSSVQMHWGEVNGIPVYDSYFAEAKNVGKANESTSAEQAVLEAQSRYDKKLRLKYQVSIAGAESVLNIKPMRAYALDAKRQKRLMFPVTAQPKFNGVRCMAYTLPDGSVRLMSRGGKDYTLPHIQDELRGIIPKGWCVDGELYAHHVSLQRIRHCIASKGPDRERIQFFCYDMLELPPTDKCWLNRLSAMECWYRSYELVTVVMSERLTLHSMDEIDDAHAQWVAAGYEGLMIRTPDGPYRMAAKSVHLLKYKKFKDAEFRVQGYEAGKDGVIIYNCVQEEGTSFKVRPVGNVEERARQWSDRRASIGKMLTVKYQERSDDNIPLMPVGVSFRPAGDLD